MSSQPAMVKIQQAHIFLPENGMPTKEEGPRIQQPEGTRRATEGDLAVLVHGMAPDKISGCDREWCEADNTIFSPERGDLHFLFFFVLP